MSAILELGDAGDLHRHHAERIGAMPGVHRVQTEIVARWIKRAGPLVIPRARDLVNRPAATRP